MEDGTKLVVEVKKKRGISATTIIAFCSLVVSICALTTQIETYVHNTTENIQTYAWKNTAIKASIPKDAQTNNYEYFNEIFNDYLSSDKKLQDFKIHPTIEIIANIYNNSPFMVAITNTYIYSTTDKNDLKRLSKYEEYQQNNHNLRRGEEWTKYGEENIFYYSKKCNLNNKAGGGYSYDGYAIDAGEKYNLWLIADIKFDDDLENYIKDYIRNHKNDNDKYNFEDIVDEDEFYFINSAFNAILNHALSDYSKTMNKEITYTFRIKTSRGKVVDSKFPVFVP